MPTIQIRLGVDQSWMKEAIKDLQKSDDPKYNGRSESEIAKMLLGPALSEASRASGKERRSKKPSRPRAPKDVQSRRAAERT